MTVVVNGVSVLALLAGCFFFISGIVGLYRLPDLYCRLHALTKADNVGLGLIIFAAILQTDSPFLQTKLLLLWLLVLFASAGMSSLIAEAAHRRGVLPWIK